MVWTALIAVLAALSAGFIIRNVLEAAVAIQAGALGVAGLGISLAQPAVLDFGLAIALLGAVHMLVLSRIEHKAVAWGLPVLALAGSAISHFAGIAGEMQGVSNLLPFIALAAGGFIAALTLSRAQRLSAGMPIHRSEAFAALAETMLGAVVRFGADGELSFISRSTSDLLGCRPFELDGKGLFERVHVMDRPAYRRAIYDAANGSAPVSLELRLRRDSTEPGVGGQYFWVDLSLAPLPSENGQAPSEVLGVLRDISIRKDAERQLETARKQAEDASEAKSRFLATIGHELRTPLNAIVGFSDMMTEGIGGSLSPTHAEYAGHISRSGHHLLDVVNMLLDMSKIEAGKFEVHAELFAPQSLVEPCLQMVEKLSRDRAIAIETDVPERLPQIVGDERACRQILINLLSNAVKFSHDGGRVSLALKRQGRMLALSVTDSGIGMRPETVQRIGEPFLQAQNGLSRRYEGTGLGLSIVKGLVALHEGRLEVVSEPGVGTTVSVLLPVDGPSRAGRTATIEHLYATRRDSDEEKWLEDERRSAAQ